jgi:protein ImuB
MSLYLPRWAMERRAGPEALRTESLHSRRPRESGDPGVSDERLPWTPAFAGATRKGFDSKPAVLAVSVGSRRLVSAVNPAAEAQGLLPGLTLADARAQVPNLAVAQADPEGDAAALLRLAQWCGRYSPWTVPQGRDGILLDIAGCAHLAGGEDKLGAELIERLAARGVTARVGIADTIGGAWAMARGGTRAVGAIAPGETRAALAPLSVRALRLDAEMVAALERLGLRRIGDLYPLPRASLAARFDAALMARLDEALGEGREALSPLPPAPPRWTRRGFADPIATQDDIAAAIRLLLEELCRHLAEEMLGARLLALTLHRVDGESASLAIGTARPSRDVAHLMRLFAERIERIDPGLGIEDMVLAAKTVEKLAAKQLSLSVPSPLEGGEQRNAASGWGVKPRSASPPTPPSPSRGEGVFDSDDTAMLIDRLANRLGARSVGRLLPHDAHLPERAQRFVFAFAPGDKVWDGGKPRPLRLLSRPEPIEAVAPVPDDPPLMFRWRRRLYRVARAEGPERIMGEWWRGTREAELLRDYYRVEDEDGRRYWLFRAGLYRPEIRARWFLHGLYA